MTPAATLDDLRQDRKGYFFRRHGANVETGRTNDRRQALLGKALGGKRALQSCRFAARAD